MRCLLSSLISRVDAVGSGVMVFCQPLGNAARRLGHFEIESSGNAVRVVSAVGRASRAALAPSGRMI